MGQAADRTQVERALIEQALQPLLNEISEQHAREVDTIGEHMEISLNALIDRQQRRMIQLVESQQAGDNSPLLAANIKTTEDRLDELNGRLERRREASRNATALSDIQAIGRAGTAAPIESHQASRRWCVRRSSALRCKPSLRTRSRGAKHRCRVWKARTAASI
jgi:hypothetical protein